MFGVDARSTGTEWKSHGSYSAAGISVLLQKDRVIDRKKRGDGIMRGKLEGI